ncbi:GAF domain-containing protein [Acuticoccus sediminis]|uniref:GAF domain-containing protein n=1 Tax=Acuticoccus sediminis TaxID=2184697 RepID=A0A8B2NVG8_9HYPH|nr:GAF domain-containing protein [Acuticoccus sediminis]RAI04147.1 GAF domain-containing protein [Acuticoccus sediminis]
MELLVEHSQDTAVEKQPFVRAIEVWVPNEDGSHLELEDGIYGGLGDFEKVARETRFAFGEGLPGRAWAEAAPIILKDLQGSYFMRGEAAMAAGLTCGVALPVLAGRVLKGVVVFFCGGDEEHVGALEIWRAAGRSPEMGLVEGYFGTAEVFEWVARRIHFMKGIGLPGLTWESANPVVFETLSAPRFLRWEKAAEVGITRGVGIPVRIDADGAWVMTFLSALHTPIAVRFEVWVPNAKGTLSFASGYCERHPDHAAAMANVTAGIGDGAIARAFRSGVPTIATNTALEAPGIAASMLAAGLGSLVAIPVFRGTGLSAVVAWYL